MFGPYLGAPQKVWSDPGTNFIGAKTVLKDLYEFLQTQDKTGIEEYAVRNSTNWAWKVLPADSPHRNGAAEAAVKVAKRALQSLGKSADLTFSEFLTTLQVAANLANQRPIDAKIQSQEDRIEYVTPNSLLMGRASHEGDFRTFNFESYTYKRLQEIETQVNSFWRAWSQLAGPNLFIRSKWHTLERNVAVGDIVWLCDQNALRGQFRLGRIVAAVPDRKGVVRDVDVLVASGSYVPVLQSRFAAQDSVAQDQKAKFSCTVLHRDVRRLVVLLPVEEQNSNEEIFRLLENRYFGNKTAIALEIVEELQAMPSVKGHQPKKIIELIRVVEKALSDLSELGDTGALKNPLMTKSLESKLPEVLKKEWLLFVATEKSVQPQKDRFDMLLSFLKSQEGIYEELDQLREEEPVRREPKAPPKQARTRATRANPQGACAVCGESGHKRRLYRCKKFKTLSLAEKKAAIRQSGTCKNCLEVHEDGECKTTFLCKSERCKGEKAPSTIIFCALTHRVRIHPRAGED
ncbi:hypothetical protein WMY93_004251 [Mugilogobius chulae]|uniref:Integrase catalytic domain-containing protein n=1 Tax=Mugilogobius chulae TaxID=88201 RepID=A0AAW0PN24_9GOBI